MINKIHYQKIHFTSSVPNFHYLPNDNINEIAFIGRSNGGKSSIINTLTSQKKLAKTSKKPGSTKLINLFEIPSKIRLIDFPGYGYSNTSKTIRQQWENTLQQYIKKRKNLIGIILTVDIRKTINKIDQNIIEQINTINIPLLIILNKLDKLQKHISFTQIQKIKNSIFPKNTQIITFSTKTLEGIHDLRKTVNLWYNNTKNKPQLYMQQSH